MTAAFVTRPAMRCDGSARRAPTANRSRWICWSCVATSLRRAGARERVPARRSARRRRHRRRHGRPTSARGCRRTAPYPPNRRSWYKFSPGQLFHFTLANHPECPLPEPAGAIAVNRQSSPGDFVPRTPSRRRSRGPRAPLRSGGRAKGAPGDSPAATAPRTSPVPAPAARLVPPQRARPAVAEHARPVPYPRLRGDAAADAGRPRAAEVRGMARKIPDPRRRSRPRPKTT